MRAGKLPTHVVAGKASAPLFRDKHLTRPSGTVTPGSKVVVTAQCSSSAQVQVLAGSKACGWLPESWLRPLPAPAVAGRCSSCKQVLCQDAFTRSARRKLRSGAPAVCETCTAADNRWRVRKEAWCTRLCQLSDSLNEGSGSIRTSPWFVVTSTAGAAVVYACLRRDSLSAAAFVGSIIAAWVLKHWLLRRLGGFEGERLPHCRCD
ncbi:unnamed protein product [Effrenium voratum]|nr:unnamed protein product [Effrenium voratum]